MSNVEQFSASVSDVGLKNWTMSGVGKTPFMGTIYENTMKIMGLYDFNTGSDPF